MRFSALMIASVLAVGMLPAVAFADPAQSGDASQASTTNPDQIVCRATPPPTGSRLGGGRECHTQRDWDQMQKDARRALEEKQMLGLQGSPPGN
jgi:hypothetical protein